MSNTSSLYWLTRLDGFHNILKFIIVFGFIVSLVILFVTTIAKDDIFDDDKDAFKIRRNFRWIFPLIIFCALAHVFTPTRNEAVFIIAGGKTLDFVASDTSINKIPAQTTKIITDYLENAIKDAKDTK